MDQRNPEKLHTSASNTNGTRAEASALTTPSITHLSLKQIIVSPTATQAQRRKHYDRAALNELGTNIKSMGVIEPIIIRLLEKPREGAQYELVAGERRWLASKDAKLETIPAIVRTLDDQQVLEIQLVENLHREGLHEIEEAEGYETLMKEHVYGIDELIAKLGKSRAYIYARIKLLALTPKGRAAFYEGKLNASTALLLARIPVAKLQDDALKLITDGGWNGPLSFREAQRQIHERYMLRLKDAPFDTRDAALVPTAGVCGACPKRTGNQPELFPDVKGADVCTDPECFAAKRAAAGAHVVAQAKADGRTVLRGDDAKRVAPYSLNNLQGGYIALDETCYSSSAKQRRYRDLIGKALGDTILLEDPRSGAFVEIVKASDYADTLRAKGVGHEVSSRARDNNEQGAKEKTARAETTWRERVFLAIRAKTPNTIAGADLRLAALKMWGMLAHEQRMRLVRLCEWAGKDKINEATHKVHKRIESMKDAELRRLLIDCALVNELHANTWSTYKPEALTAAAQRLRIDTGKIRQALKDELAAKAQGRGKKAGAKLPKATPESVVAIAAPNARTALKTPKRRTVKTPTRKATKRAA